MSIDLFVLRFVNGRPAPIDGEAARAVLAPYAVGHDPDGARLDPEPELGPELELELETPDGGTALVSVRPDGITVNRPSSGQVMELVSRLLDVLGAALVVPGGPTALHREEDRAQVPQALAEEGPVVVAPTGAEIERAVREG